MNYVHHQIVPKSNKNNFSLVFHGLRVALFIQIFSPFVIEVLLSLWLTLETQQNMSNPT